MKYVLIILFWMVPSVIGSLEPNFKTFDFTCIKPLPKKDKPVLSLKTIKIEKFTYICRNIKNSEGLSLTPIQTKNGGPFYVGYGRRVFSGEGYLLKGVTKHQADSLLVNDIQNIYNTVSEYFKEDSLKSNQLEAVTRLTYAIGIGSLKKSSLYRKIKNKEEIAEEDFTYWAFNIKNDLKHTKLDYLLWNGVLKKLKTLPLSKVMDFLRHSLERENLLLAYRSYQILKRDYSYTEKIHSEDLNPNYEVITNLFELGDFPKINLKELLSNYQKMDYRKIIKIVLDKANVDRGIKELQNQITNLHKGIQSGVKEGVSKIKNSFQELKEANKGFSKDFNKGFENLKAGKVQEGITGMIGSFSKLHPAIAAAGVAIMAFGAAVAKGVQVFKGYEQSLTRAFALTGLLKNTQEGTKAFAELDAAARQLGETTKYTAAEAAEGMQYLAMAGMKTKDIIKTLPAVLNLATIGNISLAESADIATNIMSSMGLGAQDASRAIDIMAKTITSSNTNMVELGEAMKYLGPGAKTLGIELNETNAMIGILADNGMKGGVATRALTTAFGNLSNTSGKYAKAARAIGVEIFDQQGKFRGLGEVLKDLESATVSMSQAQKLNSIQKIFGAEASGEILALLNAEKTVMLKGVSATYKGAAAFEAFAESLRDSKGAAEGMVDTIEGTLSGSLDKLYSGIEGLFLKIGSGFAPVVKFLVDSLTNAVSDVSAFFNATEAASKNWKTIGISVDFSKAEKAGIEDLAKEYQKQFEAEQKTLIAAGERNTKTKEELDLFIKRNEELKNSGTTAGIELEISSRKAQIEQIMFKHERQHYLLRQKFDKDAQSHIDYYNKSNQSYLDDLEKIKEIEKERVAWGIVLQKVKVTKAPTEEPQDLEGYNSYMAQRAQIYQQGAIQRLEVEKGLLRETNKLYLESLDKRNAEEEALTTKKYKNEIAIANTAAKKLVMTHAGKKFNDFISVEDYKKAYSEILTAGGDVNASEEDRRKALELRQASETAAIKEKELKAELIKLEEKHLEEKANRLIKERNLQLDIYNIRKDMMKLDMGRELSQTSDLERQLYLVQEQARVELEKLMLKRKQKEEDMLMQRMTGKEKYSMLTTGTVTQPDLMFKDGLEVKSKTLSQDLTDLEEAYTTEAGRSRTAMTGGFQTLTRAITGTRAPGAGGGTPPPAPTADQLRLAQLARDLIANQQALSNLARTGAIDPTTARRRDTGRTAQEAIDRNQNVVDIRALLARMGDTAGLARFNRDDRTVGWDRRADEILNGLAELLNPPGGGGGLSGPPGDGSTRPPSLPRELELELLFSSEEYDAEVEKIRQNLNAVTREVLADYYNGLGNLTKTYIDEWENKLGDTSKALFQPLEEYLVSVEKKMARHKEFYKDMQKATWSDTNLSVFEKAKQLVGNFINFRVTQFQKEREQIKEQTKLIQEHTAYRLKLNREESEEALTRNAETSKTMLDELRDRQGDEVRYRQQLDREAARATTSAARQVEIQNELNNSLTREREIKNRIAEEDTSVEGMRKDQEESLGLRLEVLKSLWEEYGGDIVKMDKSMVDQRADIQKELDDTLANTSLSDTEKAEKLKALNKTLFAYRQLGTEEARILRDTYNKKITITREGEKEITEITETSFETRMRVIADKYRRFANIVDDGIKPVVEGFVGVLDSYTEAEISRLEAFIDSLGTQLEALNNLISLSEERVSNIEGDLQDAQGQRRQDLLVQYDAERHSLAALQMQESQLEAQRQAAEAEAKKRQAEMEKRQQAVVLLNQIVTTSNMIAAAAEALKEGAKVPFPGNLIAIGTSIAALISLFATAKTAFKFEKGGLVEKGGLLQGPRHSQGGVKLEAEGGEFIMSREAVKRIGVDNLKELNFNKSLKTFDSPLSGAVSKLEQPQEYRNSVLEAAIALSSRPVVVDVQDIINSQERVNRVKVNSRY